MDGVLIDAQDWHYDAFNDALALFGLNISREEHLSTFDGLSTAQKLNILSQTKSLPTSLHDFINEMKQSITMDIVHKLCHPLPHHLDAVARLQSDGYRLAVASNSIRRTIEVMMERAQLAPFMEFYLSNQDVVNPKPDSEIYLKAIAQLGLPPSSVLIVEDSDIGFRAAKGSGAHVFKVNSVYDVTYDNIKNYIKGLESNA
ncbi:HAD family hydrolase [Oceanisphaera avium]|uniref:HAD family hydrolase n=2 Tax=Oceanisphaera avium TaxID=1903694 RepID=A0A1Y0D1D0_9GAMM|nr:HAD family hydrolase [Oceanisphaera avium]